MEACTGAQVGSTHECVYVETARKAIEKPREQFGQIMKGLECMLGSMDFLLQAKSSTLSTNV